MNIAKVTPRPANVIIPPLSASRLAAPPVDFAAAELVLDDEELVLLVDVFAVGDAELLDILDVAVEFDDDLPVAVPVVDPVAVADLLAFMAVELDCAATVAAVRTSRSRDEYCIVAASGGCGLGCFSIVYC